MKLVVFLFFLVITFAKRSSRNGCSGNVGAQIDDFSHWVLAAQICDGQTSWSLHGMWPDYGDGTGWPSCCQPESDVSEQDFTQDVLDQLENHWFTCVARNTNAWFWSHEWRVHGSCTGYGLNDYFQLALNQLDAAVKAGYYGCKRPGEEVHVLLTKDFQYAGTDCQGGDNYRMLVQPKSPEL